jgi:L-iditol 2-dehydrogenase
MGRSPTTWKSPPAAFRRGNVTRITGSAPDVEAVFAEPIACVVNSHQHLRGQPGEAVAVFGSGFIGCMHAELAFMAGADQVLVIEVNRIRAATARKLDRRIVIIDPGTTDVTEEARARTQGRGVDVAIVACSVGLAQADAMNITAKQGRVSLFGGLPGESRGFIDSNLIHYREISVHGVHASTPAQNRKALQWITEGEINVEPLSTDVFVLKEIEKAFRALNDERIMKAIVVPATWRDDSPWAYTGERKEIGGRTSTRNAQRFAGKVAVVTGAGQGMGRQVALDMAAEGVRVAICDVQKDV